MMTEREWIPCAERLPDERGYYLVTVRHTVRHLMADRVFLDRYIPALGWDTIDNMTSFEAMAWMPLPDPWKEDG